MDDKHFEIDGETFDLSDPEDKKAAIRAWLKAKSREREAPAPPEEKTQPQDSD